MNGIDIICFVSVNFSILFLVFGLIYIKTGERNNVLSCICLGLFTFVLCSFVTVSVLEYQDSKGLGNNNIPTFNVLH